MKPDLQPKGYAFDDGETQWADSIERLAESLESSRPSRVRLLGDWRDLQKLGTGVTSSVERLWIRGESIKVIDGLNVFANMIHLFVESSTPPRVDFSGLEKLDSCNLQWKDQSTLEVLNRTPVTRVAISGVKGDDFLLWPSNSRVTSLTLTRPALVSFSGIDRLSSLETVDTRLAARLSTMNSLASPVSYVYTINSPRLLDLGLGTSKNTLARIALLEANDACAISDLYDCELLEELQVGGKRSPALDWGRALSLPKLQRVQGQYIEGETDLLLEKSGRSVLSCEIVGTKKRKWLRAELSPMA